MDSQFMILGAIIVGAILVFLAIMKFAKVKAKLKAPFFELSIEGEKNHNNGTLKQDLNPTTAVRKGEGEGE